MSCVFCQIISGKIPSDIVYQDEEITAFRDIEPQAPVHILIVPKKHIGALGDISHEDATIIGEMTLVANKLAEQEGISQRGYRVVVNSGPEGGQAVSHLHMHLLGGRQLSGQLG